MTDRSSTELIEEGWERHRPAVTEAAASCADQLDGVQRALRDGREILLATRARSLYEAARDLVRVIEDAEHQLIVCGEPVPADDLDGTPAGPCALPLNHYGGHDPEPPTSLAVQARDRARYLMDRADDFGSWVNRLGLLSDQLRAFEIEKEFDPEWYEVFFQLECDSASLSHAARDVCDTTQKLIYEVPQEEWAEMERWEDDEDDSLDDDPYVTPADVPSPKVRRARGLDL